MDEVSNEMGKEMNYANPDDHIPEADRNNRVIKERIRIVYFGFRYKKYTKDYDGSLGDENELKFESVSF